MTDKLKMSFSPRTIEHLGVKMYSNVPNALAELIANAYDAAADNVYIKLYDKNEDKKIIISDDGIGMSFEEINNKFLYIGRNRREDEDIINEKGRPVTGKKGLGKLALFGIGNEIKIQTAKKGTGKEIEFYLNWNEIKSKNSGEYEPPSKTYDVPLSKQGTTITLSQLNRKSKFDKEEMSGSISKLFQFNDAGFKIFISRNDDEKKIIDNQLKYSNLEEQFVWNFPEYSKNIDSSYSEKTKITGKIITTPKPLKPGMRGVTLFAKGRLANAPEFFGASESSHGYSYMTGWLNVDFIDDWEEELISTSRQSLNWDMEPAENLRDFLLKIMRLIEKDWRTQKKEAAKKTAQEDTGIDVKGWVEKLPDEKNIRKNVEAIIEIATESTLDKEDVKEIIQVTHSLVPEYPQYHWRHLHPNIQKYTKVEYENEDYYHAAKEAVNMYQE